LTYGVDATRRALILGLGFMDPVTMWDLLMQIVETVILTPLGLIIYARLEKKARRTGALGTY
jgi:hypothetical protein